MCRVLAAHVDVDVVGRGYRDEVVGVEDLLEEDFLVRCREAVEVPHRRTIHFLFCWT